MKTFEIHHIKDFDLKDGILFLTEYNVELNLKECNSKRDDKYSSVGERDYYANPPYFDLFFVDEKIRITFVSKSLFNKKQKSKHIFLYFQRLLEDNYFVSLDLG